MLLRCVLPAAVCGALVLAPAPAGAQAAAEFYDQNCAGCHTIGQGNANGGPDLKDVTRRRERDWLIRFLLDPDDFRSEPAVAQMIKDAGGLEMPATEGLTPEMAAALLEVIEQRSASASAYPMPSTEQPLTPADAARGRDLFTGRTALAAAGPSCVHCHDAATLAPPGGGRMGPDLTRVTARLGGARGVSAWLRTTPTPVMRAVYRTAALTPEESHALAAFFDEAATSAEVPAATRLGPLIFGSVALSAIALALVGMTGARRFRRLRRPLVAGYARRAAEPGGSR